MVNPNSVGAELEISCKSVGQGGAGEGFIADVAVAAAPTTIGTRAAVALASMSRPRRTEREEVWAQLFIDGTFVDVGRAIEVDSEYGSTDVTFVARFAIPSSELDGNTHRIRVCFVSSSTREVPDLAPQAIAESDFEGKILGQA